jgi:hypothetical protein
MISRLLPLGQHCLIISRSDLFLLVLAVMAAATLDLQTAMMGLAFEL